MPLSRLAGGADATPRIEPRQKSIKDGADTTISEVTEPVTAVTEATGPQAAGE